MQRTANKPSQPRRLEVKNPPAAPRPYLYTGVLIRINPGGFGFLGTGKGNQDYFVRRTQVPPEAWKKGARFGFNAAPAALGTSCPKVKDLVVLSIPQTEVGEVAYASHRS
jgi:cold shock CspA family protein